MRAFCTPWLTADGLPLTAQRTTSPETPIFGESGDNNHEVKSQRATQRTTRQRVTKTRIPPEWRPTSPFGSEAGDVICPSQIQIRQPLTKTVPAPTSPPPVTSHGGFGPADDAAACGNPQIRAFSRQVARQNWPAGS